MKLYTVFSVLPTLLGTRKPVHERGELIPGRIPTVVGELKEKAEQTFYEIN